MNELRLGFWLIALAIVAGAFGAHGLRGAISASDLAIYEKAVSYQIVQGIGIILAGLLAQVGILSSAQCSRARLMLFVGMLIFCGSLYLLVLTNTRWLGAITPIGGILMILGWGYLGIVAKRRQ